MGAKCAIALVIIGNSIRNLLHRKDNECGNEGYFKK